MDLISLYTSSPDWIKALMVILPHATLLGLAWLVLRRPAPVQAPTQRMPPNPLIEVLPPVPARRGLAEPDRDMKELAAAGDITQKSKSAALLAEDGASRCD